MILERHQGQRESRILTEPEAEWDVDASILAVINGDHIGQQNLFGTTIGQLTPDFQPFTKLFVNLLSSDFQLYRANQNMSGFPRVLGEPGIDVVVYGDV